MNAPRRGGRGESGGARGNTTLLARSDFDQLCARLYARPDLLDRLPVDYADSGMWVTRDGETVMVSLREREDAA